MAFDRAERKILAILQENGRIPNVELADQVGLSESPCYRRVKNLERKGVIVGYPALVDRRALGFTVMAFVQVTMEKQPDVRTEAFHRCVRDEAHIVECYATSGPHDYLLKVVAKDMDHFSELVLQGILKYPGVLHVDSSFSLTEIKQGHALPA